MAHARETCEYSNLTRAQSSPKTHLCTLFRGHVFFDADIEGPSPARYRCLAAAVMVLLATRDYVAADAAFLDALGVSGFASATQAQAIEDLLVACKSGDEEALRVAAHSSALSSLDFEVAKIAKKLTLADTPIQPPALQLPPDLPPTQDDEDDLPDFT